MRYAKFGLLQQITTDLAEIGYGRATGRVTSADREAALRAALDAQFSEFRKKDRADGSPKFATSWCDKTTRDLAEASANALHLMQYRHLYQGAWSEQTHGSPVVFLDSMFTSASDSWIEDVTRSDDQRVVEAAMMLVTLFCELWMLLEHFPGPPPTAAIGWTEAIRDTAQRLNPEGWEASQLPTSRDDDSPG